MSYNHFNNDLPVPPHGYADWRAFYADSLAAFATLGGATEPHLGYVAVPTGNNDLTEMPYWKIAHYAAREQAEHNRAHPPLSLDQLAEMRSILMGSMRQPVQWLVDWLGERFEEALARRRKH